MDTPATPVLKDLVLVGGGHSHVIVLRRFGMAPMPGVRLTVISRDIHTPYSGMLPGLIAGHYGFDDVHIDLAPLCRFAGARLFHDEVDGLDLQARLVHCRGRPPVRFDVLSLDIGSTPSRRAVPGAAEHAVPVKPISNFMQRWEQLLQRIEDSERPLVFGAVGAGAGGIELTLSIQHALTRRLTDAGRPDDVPRFHVFAASDELLPTHSPRVRRHFTGLLAARGIALHTGCRVASVQSDGVLCADGTEVALDEILWVTDAGAAPWLATSGLDLDERGFIAVRDTLESTSHPGVFAAGDVAAVLDHPREKAGVFAVRQGKPLERNLRRALTGRPLVGFAPQRSFLSIVSTGDKDAVASKGSWSAAGPWVWRWKDWIDRRFMRRFSELPAMSAGRPPDVASGLADGEAQEHLARAAMRCGGCGAKVGATVLERALAKLSPVRRDDVLFGVDAPDDAAALRVPAGQVLVQSVDYLRALVDDPYTFGRIAAVHALGDVYAMGAAAQSALAVVTIPYGLPAIVEDTLEQLLQGALAAFAEADCALVGGHTSEGAELGLGFAVNGLADERALLRKGGLRPGDRLLLTKPLGTGTLFAADMRGRAKGRWISAAIDSMILSHRTSSEILLRHGATAATDVTGFGLVGHLAEMTRASGVSARLVLAHVPLLDGALECVRAGIVSSLQPSNLAQRRAVYDAAAVARRAEAFPLLFDPQTSGGLLAGVPAQAALAALAELRAAGYERAAIIGRVEAAGSGDGTASIRVEA